MIVIDASVVLEVLLATPDAASLQSRVFAKKQSLHAPHLLDLEVAQVLRRYFLAGRLTADRGATALEYLSHFPITRYPHDAFLPRVWELRHNFTAYDAAYVALAEALNAPLLTRDRALASAAGHTAKVELV
jgi:predicted nucleic acid-binding protein